MPHVRKAFTSAMEFTDEEKLWLLSISADIPEDKKLNVMEEGLRTLAKPKSQTEAQLFQVLAAIRFGLTDPVISELDTLINSAHERPVISSQCG